MFLSDLSVRLTKSEAACLTIGLIMIVASIITQTSIAKADDLVVRIDVPLTGTLSIMVFDDEGTQTSTNTVGFGSIVANDSSLFERNSTETISDLKITVQTNSNEWNLTQHISQDRLKNNSEDEIDLYWKTNDQTLFNVMGFEQNPDLLANSGASTGYSVDLDYALDVPTSTPPGEYSGIVTYTLAYN